MLYMEGGGRFNAAAYLSVILSMNDEAWISSGAYIVYVVLEGIPIVFFLLGFLYIHRRKEGLLAQNTAPLYTDDDIYWKNGTAIPMTKECLCRTGPAPGTIQSTWQDRRERHGWQRGSQ